MPTPMRYVDNKNKKNTPKKLTKSVWCSSGSSMWALHKTFRFDECPGESEACKKGDKIIIASRNVADLITPVEGLLPMVVESRSMPDGRGRCNGKRSLTVQFDEVARVVLVVLVILLYLVFYCEHKCKDQALGTVVRSELEFRQEEKNAHRCSWLVVPDHCWWHPNSSHTLSPFYSAGLSHQLAYGQWPGRRRRRRRRESPVSREISKKWEERVKERAISGKITIFLAETRGRRKGGKAWFETHTHTPLGRIRKGGKRKDHTVCELLNHFRIKFARAWRKSCKWNGEKEFSGGRARLDRSGDLIPFRFCKCSPLKAKIWLPLIRGIKIPFTRDRITHFLPPSPVPGG